MSRPTSKALAALIQSQALDDGAESVTPENHLVRNETDTGLTLDYLADKRPTVPSWRVSWSPPSLILLGCCAWSREAEAPCPVCGGSVPPRWYCARCDTAGQSVEVEVGHGVDAYPDLDHPLSPTRYVPGRLAGGKGRLRKG
jgi:hypothetical protein